MDGFRYQYTIGGAVFLIGLLYAWRQGAIGLQGRGLYRLAALLVGFGLFAGVQGYLQYAPMATLPEAPSPASPLPSGAHYGTTLDYAIMAGYLLVVLAIGMVYARKQSDLNDYFFAGRRFSWGMVSMSLVATTVGSYSFVKYGQVAYEHGLSSSQSYLNDWFWMPLLAFGWLPILYFSRITSIPEYFEKRFDRRVRGVVTTLLLVYLVGYVGVNLFTMGRALEILVGWPVFWSAAMAAAVSAFYVSTGGQTSVIMTDLFQGILLLGAGVVILVLGVDALGGWEAFWQHLPREHRMAFSHPTADPQFPAVGIFWQDAMANSAMFYFLNQSIIMRFLAARSIHDARKAALITPIILMPLAAISVASGGWVARALEHAGVLPHGMKSDEVFFIATNLLASPGVFGLVMAALTAALMSTVDSLLTAVSAVVVNDVYRPHIRPNATEAQMLRVARRTSVAVAAVGVALVPVFLMFDTIYAAHGAFTAAVTPPLVAALLLSVFWRRCTRAGVLAALLGGSLAIFASVVEPGLIAPFAHGIPEVAPGDGWLGGAKVHTFARALFGLAISFGLGIAVSLFTRPQPDEQHRGLVWGSIDEQREACSLRRAGGRAPSS